MSLYYIRVNMLHTLSQLYLPHNMAPEQIIQDNKLRSFEQLAAIIKVKFEVPEMVYNKLYDTCDLHWRVTDHLGALIPVIGLIRKTAVLVVIEFSTGDVVSCAEGHLFATSDRRDVVTARELKVGDVLYKVDGSEVTVASKVESGEHSDFYDIQVRSDKMLYSDAAGFVHHNTHTVEETLGELGLEDGNGYFKNTSSGSAAGLYKTLFMNRTGIVVLDDCDTIVSTQEGRNLLKAALDTKKKRKLVWAKAASWLFDPNDEIMMGDALSDVEAGLEPEKFPRYFDFEGRVIMISNLSPDVLDPDGALATRGFIITLDPTKEEVFAFMRKIAPNIPIEGELSLEQRMEVVSLIEKQTGPVNIRKLVRGMNLAASGVPNFQRLIERYC